MPHSCSTLRSILLPALVGLQLVSIIGCDSVQPLTVDKPTAADSRPLGSVSQYGVHFITITTTDSSLTTGQQTQATGMPRMEDGSEVPQAPISWTISPTAVATISESGVITGGSTSGTATVFATADGVTRSMTLTVDASAAPSNPSAPVHMVSITTSATTIKIGEAAQLSGVVRDRNGTPITGAPIMWSSSPTSVATTTTTNSTEGTVTGRGVGTATVYAKADTVTRQISITVIDSASAPGTTPPPPPPGAGGGSFGGSTPAALPRSTVATDYPSAARQVRVPAGADLQAAINAARPGDELLLAPGARYVGAFALPNKGNGSGWIVIRTDVSDAALGAPGTRMTPSRAASANLAKILTTDVQPAFATDFGANHYRITGLEIGSTNGSGNVSALLRFGTDESSQTTANTANNLIVDRSYVHGGPSLQLTRCVALNSASTAIVDSWLGECHSNQGDSQAIAAWNGPGPFLIQNNHLEAGHEVIAFGGGTFTVSGGSPSDITIRGNHVMRPVEWKGVWQAKNLFETKHAKRVLIEGNVFENNWEDAQNGFAILIKSVNQDNNNPWTQSADITLRYNRIRNTGNVFNISGTGGDNLPDVKAARVSIYDNLIENVNVGPYTADGIAFQLLNGVSDVAIFHNTTLNTGRSLDAVLFDGDPVQRLTFQSNVVFNGQYGVFASGGAGSKALQSFAPGALFANNLIIGGDCSILPSTTICPSSLPSIFSQGYDGRTIGADVSQVDAQTRNAVVAP